MLDYYDVNGEKTGNYIDNETKGETMNNSEMNNKIDKGHLLSTFDNSQHELFSNHKNLPSTKDANLQQQTSLKPLLGKGEFCRDKIEKAIETISCRKLHGTHSENKEIDGNVEPLTDLVNLDDVGTVDRDLTDVDPASLDDTPSSPVMAPSFPKMISGSQNETHSENKEINKIDKTPTTPKINVDQKLSEKSKRLKMVLLLSSIFLMTSKRKPEMEFPASTRVINISTLTPYLYLGAPERLTWPNPFGIIKNSISCLNQIGIQSKKTETVSSNSVCVFHKCHLAGQTPHMPGLSVSFLQHLHPYPIVNVFLSIPL